MFLSNDKICQNCHVRAFKYVCPGCDFRSCSVDCVKQHKVLVPCTGRRDPSKFVPRSQYNATHGNQDYRFLSDVEQKLHLAKRLRSGTYRDVNHRRRLQEICRTKKGIELVLAPEGLSRSLENRTTWSKKGLDINWTVEILSHDKRVLCHGISEHTQLKTLLEPYVDITESVRLKSDAASTTPSELGLDMELGQCLAGTRFVEFPTLQVSRRAEETIGTSSSSPLNNKHPEEHSEKHSPGFSARDAAAATLLSDYSDSDC